MKPDFVYLKIETDYIYSKYSVPTKKSFLAFYCTSKLKLGLLQLLSSIEYLNEYATNTLILLCWIFFCIFIIDEHKVKKGIILRATIIFRLQSSFSNSI